MKSFVLSAIAAAVITVGFGLSAAATASPGPALETLKLVGASDGGRQLVQHHRRCRVVCHGRGHHRKCRKVCNRG